MTSLWLGAALITLAALAMIAWPLLGRRQAGAARGVGEVEVYREQLAEIGRDLERGAIAEAEARAARLEVERRLLRAGERDETQPIRSTRLGTTVVAATLVGLPLFAAGLYAGLGSPRLPDRPLAARETAPNPAPEIAQMVARLESRLAEQPDDLEGWLRLGRSKSVLGDNGAAVAAFRRAHGLAARDPRAVAGLAEALVAAAGSVVTPEAQRLFAELEALTPQDLRAPYYLGLAAAQEGDFQAALEGWRKVLAASPADAPWRPQVEAQVRDAAGQAGIDPGPILAQAAAAPPAESTSEAADEIARMSPDEQQEQIRGMVDRLEARLAADGSDPVGWLRLAQSRQVLGENEAARAVLEKAVGLHPGDVPLLKRLGQALLEPPAEGGETPAIGDRARDLFARAAALAPDDPEPLWYLGLRAAQDGRRDEARALWGRTLAKLEPSSPAYSRIKAQIDALGG